MMFGMVVVVVVVRLTVVGVGVEEVFVLMVVGGC